VKPLAGLALTALLATPAQAHAGDRWPLWPSEVTRLGEPLFAADDKDLLVATEASKLHALRALDRYPTPLIADIVLAGLEDRAVAVRREALQICHERALLRCIPAAVAQWQAGSTPDTSLRIAAMRVIALDAGTTPAHADLVLGALRDPDEAIRAESAYTLARVTWPSGQAQRVRTTLIGKLTDTAPPVRRAAARALGLLGPQQPATPAPNAPNAPRFTDPAPLALARLLTDPDPQVRQDAAETLGALGDPRAAPPLIRAIETGDEAYVSRAMVIALGLLPGPDVDAALLRLLDAPPRGLTYRVVAESLGRRPTASPAVVDGLVARLREDALQSYVFESLLLLGDAAAPALRAAQSRGLEPPLDLAVRRLLAALTPPTTPASTAPSFPPAADRDAWHRQLTGTNPLAAAAELARLAPDWLGLAAAGAFSRDHGPALRRPWLLAVAVQPRAILIRANPVTAARLATWSADASLPALDRCLALAALARGEHDARATAAIARAAADASPSVRACAAVETRDPVDFAGLLRDGSPRVRATAAFVLAACPRRVPPATQAIVADLATRDPHPGVLRTARAALARLQSPHNTPCTWHLRDAGEPTRNDATSLGWVDATWQPTDTAEPELLRLPVHALGDRRWLFLPAAERLTPMLRSIASQSF